MRLTEFIHDDRQSGLSIEALQRFFDALTAQAEHRPVPQPPRSKLRKKQIEQHAI